MWSLRAVIIENTVRDQVTYLGEVRANWRFVAAASIGLAAGYSLNNFITNIFTPLLIKQFNWSRSDFALIGATTFLAVLTLPVAGRLADAFGVRRMALIGVVAAPAIFLGLSVMTGQFMLYFVLTCAQVIIVGGTTSATTYSRLIAHQFNRARGMALAIATCTPAIVGAMVVPFLSGFIGTHGWRAGYVAVAVGTGIAGIIAILLIPRGVDHHRSVRVKNREASSSYRTIVRNPAFLLIIAGMILCNFSFSLQTSQLKVILLDRGVDSAFGSWAISLFAFSVVVGRLLCGLALDRFPTYVVAALSLGLPGLGLLVLASGTSAPAPIVVAAFLLGLSLGAESDILPYVVMRFFSREIFSTVLSLVQAAIALSIGCGALILSFVLRLTGSYTPFLVFSATSALLGGGMFFLLRRVPTTH
jgi:MFS family permease